MPITRFETMSHNPMADRFNENIQKDIETDEDDGLHERYAYAAALFFYHSEAQYRLIPYQIKYHGNIRAGRYFGRMLGNRLTSSELFEDVDMVVPVPLHWTRKWKRGYNQAEVIAGAVAEALGAPMRTDLLRRRKRTTTQTRMEVEDKRKNVAEAFVSTPSLADIAAQDGIRHLLLIDDVFTTGATLHACFVALRTVLPASVRISVATLGFVGRA